MRITVLSLLAAANLLAGPTFTKDVAPILYKSCAGCHRPGEMAPMSLLDYQSARPWAKSIREAVLLRKMPPWFADASIGHFANDPRLSAEELETIKAWVDSRATTREKRKICRRSRRSMTVGSSGSRTLCRYRRRLHCAAG